MKNRILIILFLFSAQAFAKTADTNLFFEEALPFDGACNALKQDDNYKITEAMRTELTQRIPEFEQIWKKKGPELLKTMSELLKHPYGRSEETMALTLCQWFSPMSQPLMLRMREYLKSTVVDNPKGPTEIKPDLYFVAQVFHELIHRYLDKYYADIDSPQNSALVKTHASEPSGVLSHLHHLSIQKAVYLKLNREEDLKKIIELDSQIRGGVYKRAWEIVNADGYQKYIDELSKYKGRKK